MCHFKLGIQLALRVPIVTDEEESAYMQDDKEMTQLESLEALLAENEDGAEEPVNIGSASDRGSGAGDYGDCTAASAESSESKSYYEV